jgi:5-methyltetrahydrofolate--homocysteine methyltransferase
MLIKQKVLQQLQNCVINFEMDKIKKIVAKAIKAGIKPYLVVEKLSEAMDVVGKRYEAGEYFLSDLIMAGETMKVAMEVLEPHLKTSIAARTYGVVVIGTVQGDLHDLGKNLVVTLLNAAGFQVIDLGVDVPPERFVNVVKTTKPDILALSCLLTTTIPSIEKTIQMLTEEGLRDDVWIIIGGAPLNTKIAEEIGADAYGKDAVEGVTICKNWMESKYRGE